MCLDDNLDGDTSSWMRITPNWVVQPNPPGGAFAVTFDAMSSTLTHPALLGFREGRIELDFRVDNMMNGDFNVYLVEPPWTDPIAVPIRRYDIGMFPLGTDTMLDQVARYGTGAPTFLVQHPRAYAPGTWHRLAITRSSDGALAVELDGVEHMRSPPDAVISPPFDVVFGLYNAGAIDNVHVTCAR